MNGRLQYALAYLRKGWSIFPCKPVSSIPLVKWKEYQDRRPTEDEVRKWWTENPTANIAIVTGKISDLVVVDVDPRNGGSSEGQPPTSCKVQTGGGGEHLFYAYPQGVDKVDTRANPDTGLDVKGDGGYVVAPPSEHHKTLRQYRWIEEGERLPPPRWILDKKDSSKEEVPKEKWVAYLTVNGLGGEGERNSNAIRLAGYYAGKGLPPDVTRLLLATANAKSPSPLGEDELHRTVQSAYATEKRNKQDKEAAEVVTFQLMELDQFVREYESHEVGWAVEGWLPLDTIGMISAPPESYKSWILYDLALSIATGLPFLGHYTVTPKGRGNVIIANQEDFLGQTAQRIQLIRHAKHAKEPWEFSDGRVRGEITAPHKVYFHTEKKIRFADARIMDALEEQIDRLRPKLLVIDPFYSVASDVDGYFAKDVQHMRCLKDWRDKYGVSTYLCHHSKKSSEGFDRQGMWGSQFLNAFLETGMRLTKDRPDDFPNVVGVLRHFKTAPAGKKQALTFDINTQEGRFDYSVAVSEYTEVDKEEKKGGRKGEEAKGIQLYRLLQTASLTASECAQILGIKVTEVRELVNANERIETRNENGNVKYFANPE